MAKSGPPPAVSGSPPLAMYTALTPAGQASAVKLASHQGKVPNRAEVLVARCRPMLAASRGKVSDHVAVLVAQRRVVLAASRGKVQDRAVVLVAQRRAARGPPWQSPGSGRRARQSPPPGHRHVDDLDGVALMGGLRSSRPRRRRRGPFSFHGAHVVLVPVPLALAHRAEQRLLASLNRSSAWRFTSAGSVPLPWVAALYRSLAAW